MKKVLLILGICVSLLAYAADNGYQEAMEVSLQKMAEAQTMEDFQSVSNSFGRIAKMEPLKWLPAYYAAYAQTIVAANTVDPKVKDQYLDQSQAYLDGITSLEKDESEVMALQAFVFMIRISVDPGSRGQSFSQKSGKELQKAKKIDPQNPRVLFLMAQLTYGTAQFFGSDTSDACQMNEDALQLFEESAEDRYEFAPAWGKRQAEGFRSNCNN